MIKDYIRQFDFAQKLKYITRIKTYLSSEYKGEVCDDFSAPAVLDKKNGKDFVILNLTDIHFSDYDIRMPLGLAAAFTLRRLVRDVRPDLITVTGDIVCAASAYNSIRYLTDLFTSFGIPWAPVFGNHEDETNCDKNYLADIMMKSPCCLLRKGPSSMGVGNYIVVIADENGKPVETLFMTDSKHSQPDSSQAEWIISEGAKITDGEKSVFMHIPLPEYQAAYDAAFDTVSGKWREGFAAFGEQHEKICCERDKDGNPVYRGFLDKIRSVKGLKYVFCGHEHLNDWSVLYNGVRLTYTLKVGRGSGFRLNFNGGTVITVGDNGIKSIAHRSTRLLRFHNIEYFEL
jgi:3',5'-cyclic AMP phosphodiesterase CpdA